MIPLKTKAMKVTESINIRWNQYNRKRKGVILRIIFPILPVICLLGEVEYTEINEKQPCNLCGKYFKTGKGFEKHLGNHKVV